MDKRAVRLCLNPSELPKPAGCYSQVVRCGNLVFVAGMGPRDADRNLVGTDIQSQTAQALENMRLALASAGANLEDVCTVTAFLADISRDFRDYDDAYRRFFPADPPARATVQAGLVGILVEIQAIASVA